MSPIGHLITATSLATAFMRINGVSWADGIAELPRTILMQSSLDIASPSGLTLISLGAIVGARGPDRLEVPSFNHFTKIRSSLIPHRTLTHWPGTWVIFTIICCWSILVSENTLFLAFSFTGIGFCASAWLHLAMDIMTPSGIPLLTPFGNRTSLNLYKTNSIKEWLYISVFVIFSQASSYLLD